MENLAKQLSKVAHEITMLNSFIEAKGNPDQAQQIEGDSKLVRRVKPLLTERSFSLDALQKVDLQLIPKAEKD